MDNEKIIGKAMAYDTVVAANTKLKEEVERLRGMVDYASNAPDRDSMVSILVDALDGVTGAENVKEVRGARADLQSQLDKANKRVEEYERLNLKSIELLNKGGLVKIDEVHAHTEVLRSLEGGG